jgi:hypothetical protein
MASLPASAYCGESLEFTETVASGATGNAVLRHIDSGVLASVALSISGTSATATFQPEKTANFPSGLFTVSLVLEVSGNRVISKVGTIKLLAPPDRAPTESHARKMVAMLEAHIEGRISDEGGRGQESYTVGGIPITKIPIPEARALLTKYRAELEVETIKARAEAGVSTKRIIYSKFE